MQADRPKQYLTIAGKTILEHTLNNLYAHPQIKQVIVALSPEDEYFSQLLLANQPWVKQTVSDCNTFSPRSHTRLPRTRHDETR